MDNPAKTENYGGAESSPKATSTVPDTPKDETSTLETLKKENLEMQEELKKREQMVARRDELRARELLGGRAAAGNPQKKEETPKEYKDRILKGG